MGSPRSALMQLRKRRNAGEREPILVGIGDAGLLLHGMGEIGEREALGLQLVARDASGEGHRLEADAAGAIDIFERQPDDVADLVIVEAFDDGGNEDDFQAGFPDVFDALQLLFPQGFAARAAVDIVADAVELQIERVQAGFLGLLGEFQIGEFQAVGGRLEMRKAHLLGHAEDIEETRVNGRLAARKLHDAAGHGPLVAQRLQHLADGLEIRLVNVTGGVGVGEADRASQVAAVGEIDVGQAGVAGVEIAKPAIVGAAGGVGDCRIFQAAIVAETPLFHLEVKAASE